MSNKQKPFTVTATFKDRISKSLRERYVDCHTLEEALVVYDSFIVQGRQAFSMDLIEAVVYTGSKETSYYFDNLAK